MAECEICGKHARRRFMETKLLDCLGLGSFNRNSMWLCEKHNMELVRRIEDTIQRFIKREPVKEKYKLEKWL